MKREDRYSAEQKRYEEYINKRDSHADFIDAEQSFDRDENGEQSFFGDPVMTDSEQSNGSKRPLRGNERTYSRRNKQFYPENDEEYDTDNYEGYYSKNDEEFDSDNDEEYYSKNDEESHSVYYEPDELDSGEEVHDSAAAVKPKTKVRQKNDKRKQISSTNVFLYLIASFVWLDIWFRIFVHKGIDFPGFFINLFFSLSLAFVLTFLITLFPKRWWRRLMAVPLVITLIFFAAQYVYYAFFRTLFTWFSMLRSAQVAEFAGDVVLKILANIPVLLLAFVPLIIFFAKNPIVNFLKDKRIIPEHWLVEGETYGTGAFFGRDKILGSLFLVTAALVTFTFALLFVNVGDRSVNSAYDLFYETDDPLVASNRLGLITAMSVDLRHFLNLEESEVPTEETLPDDVIIQDPTSSANAGTDTTDPSADPSGTVPEPTAAPQKVHAFPIDFDTISESESNETLRNMALYFNDIEPSKSNEQTGIFKGYNLIFITAESHSLYSADPELTPTLWHMQENGIKFNNFYNPVWGVSTSDGEYTGITGLAPKAGVWSLSKSAENNMAMTPGNMLKRLGYSTSAWHNHTYTYYGRDESHPNLGYDTYKGVGNGLEVKKTWPESDLEMMELSFDEFTATEPFHAYFMTVSGHMNYTFRGNYMASKNRDLVKDLPYNEGGRAYMATQIEFDKAMEYLLQRLRDEGIADRTLIVINADHYPYGLEKADYDQLAGKTLEENFEIYHNSLIMYVDGMEPMVVDKVCFTLDILPTIYNLMDIPFDSRLLMGSDVFSERDPLAFFINRSWITDKGSYNAVTKKFTPAPGVTVEDEEAYISRITHSVQNKRKFSAQILDYDYFDHILPDSIWEIVNKDSGYPPVRE